jgi:hypothetical protein
MRAATFDSSFWVHAVYLDLIEFLLLDFELICTKAMEDELGSGNPTAADSRHYLLTKLSRAAPRSEKMKLYGDGERDAINLVLERKVLLLIDDWRPYEAAQAAGVEVVNSLAYLVGLYEQKRITLERVLHALARTTRRGTLRPEWIQSAVRVVAEIRRKGENS